MRRLIECKYYFGEIDEGGPGRWEEGGAGGLSNVKQNGEISSFPRDNERICFRINCHLTAAKRDIGERPPRVIVRGTPELQLLINLRRCENLGCTADRSPPTEIAV